ncbi:MAG: AEC family transporter [Bacillota bacterium]
MQIVIYSLIGILLLAIPGYFLKKFNMVGEGGLSLLSNILLYVTTPVLIFVNFQKMDYDPSMASDLLWMFLLSFVSFAIIALLVIVILKPHKRGDFQKLFCFGITFANSGYMAIPFLEAIYPGDSLVIMYSAIFICVFNVFLWTVGVFYVTGDKKYVSIKKAFLNPATIALLFSLPLFVLNIRVSNFSESIFSSISSFSTMNTPTSMLVLGIKLADAKIGELIKNKKLYLISLFKLFIVPIAIYFILIVPFKNTVDPTMLRVLLITIMMPGAAAATVMFEKFGHESSDAAMYFLLSTCLSVATIPIMMNLVNLI